MRDKATISENIRKINIALNVIREQITLVESEYQTNAIELTGEASDTYAELSHNLNIGYKALAAMLHFEIDIIH